MAAVSQPLIESAAARVYHLSHKCYTALMPTTRARHLITETDTIAEALDDAARRWPEHRDSRAKLLVHLVEEGHHALIESREAQRQARLDAIIATSGVLTGAYPADYLERLREDWPE